MANYIIGIALIIMAIFLVIAVLMQHGKDHRLSGSIAGGAESFFGKTKGKTVDAMFSKLTTIVTIIFVILVVVLYVIQPDVDDMQLPVVDDTTATDITDVADDTTADDAEATAEGEAEAEVAVEDEAEAEAEAEVAVEGEAEAEAEAAPEANTDAE